jgi:hypothetical protein
MWIRKLTWLSLINTYQVSTHIKIEITLSKRKNPIILNRKWCDKPIKQQRPSIITLYHSFRRRTLTMQLVSSIKHICEQFRYTPQQISTKYNNEPKTIHPTEHRKQAQHLIKMNDINIQHQNRPSQLKTARFPITFEFDLTKSQDQYSYDHKHLGVFARYLGLICQQTIKQTLSRLLRTNSEVPEFHKVL